MNSIGRLHRVIWLGVLAGGAAVAAQAADLDYSVYAGVGYSDNIERTNVDAISTGTAIAGVELQGERESGRLTYDVSGDIAYHEYFDSAVEGLVVGSLFSRATYEIVPATFAWNAGARYDQVRRTLLRPATPGNLDDVITLSTGPTLRARVGDAFEALLDGHVTHADYSERDFDSDTVGGRLILGRRLSPRSLLGIGGAFDEVTFDSQVGLGVRDFDRREAFLRLEMQGARTALAAEAGPAKVSSDTFEESGTMLRAHLTRRLTPFISGYAAYSQEYTTSEEAAFSSDPELDGVAGADPSILTAAARQAKSAEVGLRLRRPRTLAELAVFRQREVALGTSVAVQRKVHGLRANFTRALTPRSRGSLLVGYSSEEIPALFVDVNELSVRGEVGFRFGRALGLDVRLEFRDRDGQFAADGYSEFSGGVFLRYGRVERSRLSPSVPADEARAEN
jgi:hypothetical protein